MKQIELTKGKYTTVDDEDLEKLSVYKWQVSAKGYAQTLVKLEVGYKLVLMHRLILNTPKGLVSDHINGDRLDNRRTNLRVVTNSQNQFNRKCCSTSKTGKKGVQLRFPGRTGKPYVARIWLKDKFLTLGCFENVDDAARAYDKAAIKYFGEYAKLNF